MSLSFVTGSGRKVFFEELNLRVSSLGFLEGRPESIRREVLRRLPDEVIRRYGQTGLLLREPPDGPLPAYTFFVHLHSYEPVKPGSDCSSLVVVWFADTLPDCLPVELSARLQGIAWEEFARDGDY